MILVDFRCIQMGLCDKRCSRIIHGWSCLIVNFLHENAILDIPPISTNPDGFLGHVGSMEFCCFSICRCLMASHTGLLVVPTCSKDPQGIRLRGVNMFSRNIFNVGSQTIQYQKPPARSMCVESMFMSMSKDLLQVPCVSGSCVIHISTVLSAR